MKTIVQLLRVAVSGAFLSLSVVTFGLDKVPTQTPDQVGQQVFEEHCASCHDAENTKAPKREALAVMTFDNIMLALEFGRMQPQAAGLDKIQKAMVAKYLAGDSKVDESWIDKARCDSSDVDAENVLSAGWGLSEHNSRYVSGAVSGLNKSNVGSLKLKWAFAYPRVTDARSQPVLTKDTIFSGSKSGNLFALDRDRGCIKWRFKADASVRSALVLGQRAGQPTLYFGDSLSTAYAVDAVSGQLIWKQSLSVFPTSIITGTPAYHDGRLYVPISSYEIAAAGMASYPCCRSHGAVVALDVADGAQQWIWHGTSQATLQGKTESGLMQFGPSGVSVWSTPTIDAERGVLYIGTAENLSAPATDTSDSIVALELDSGKLRWKYQALENDIWNSACLNGGPNCPENAGGDFDFGAAVILTQRSDGRDILLAGQKSGAVYGFDPDGYSDGQGKLLWKNSDTENQVYSPNPGVHWGMAAANGKLFVAIADAEHRFPGYVPRPGLSALNIDDGKTLWRKAAERGCKLQKPAAKSFGLQAMREGKDTTVAAETCAFHYGLSMAVTATDGVVFAGRLDGKMQAYDAQSGEILWEYDTARTFETVNGIEGKGGALDVDGAVIGDGMLFLHSGYSMFGQLPGNVLLGFEAD